ncbi:MULTISPECIES: EamA family transporter [unclassified Actinomyces]|uniref:EamA family transporter n=1 Tax=unclassified Actinomyces TaxID=2609248 RepID=UPI002016C461|nr:MULTISPECIES: EamA family transporter [unclassified Actinomyces]MCL3776559.1 EamA family transporter [Actinomyces sp. AC-20-1]MCL3788845.1 EamA family transporter [Actinomyces sp. 187325]MCL3791049.1 EamA family transporter [Actinomyces sp. 186855]MCL3793425.1 EamA family transporter [Actinomyces sp. 217892]
MWVLLACGSALFAGLTSILAKQGIRTTDSTVAMALRTVVVLVGAWAMVLVVGSQDGLAHLDARSTGLLVLSGLTTGASWLCYFKALQLGSVSKVVPFDKLSTVLTVLLALILLGERVSAVGALGIVLMTAGTLLMLDADDLRGLPRALREGGGWLAHAVGSALFAALTAVLSKAGIVGVDSTLGTAIRTGVVLVMAWALVALSGRLREARRVPRDELGLILASGAATCASWLCYHRALQDGPASVVVPIDKLSVLVTVAFSVLVLREALSRRYLAGLTLLVGGTLAMLA